MSRRSLLVTACVVVLGAGLVAAQPSMAAPSTRPSAPPSTPAAPATAHGSGAVAASTRPSWFAAHGTHPTRVVSGVQERAAVVRATAASHPTGLQPGTTSQPTAADGTVHVSVTGSAAAVRAGARQLGGSVLATAAGHSVVAVRRSDVGRLAGASGVTAVAPVNHPYANDVTPGPSQAVAASRAGNDPGTWHPQNPDTLAYSGITGQGVKLAIVDLGFGNQSEYTAEVGAGHLNPDTQVQNTDCGDGTTAGAFDGESHGLAVAEVAQQQAPGAQLYLYCVDSPEGLSDAVDAIIAAGITLASSSIGWYQDARGDGSGPAGSVADSVKRARKAGVLWINSAGNEVPQHFGGTLADANKDGYLDLGNANPNAYPFESNFYYTAPGSTQTPTSLAFIFQWDEWPAATHRVTLIAAGVQCNGDFGSGGDDDCQGSSLPVQQITSTSGGEPALGLDTSNVPNTSDYPQVWEVLVHFEGSFVPGLRYDLFGEGDTDGASDLSCPNVDSNDNCIFAAAAKSGSVVSPANSPYAMAVGAVDAGSAYDGDSQTAGTLEYFSSQGPTVDQRVKPDITGWDGLSSYVSGFEDGFYGTSAAAPSVAGAAVLVKAANPSLDAAQVQNYLEQHARVGGVPLNPPTNLYGHGRLNLGTPPAGPSTPGFGAPAAGRYTGLASPQRVLSSHPLGAGRTVTITMPSSIPTDATAVALNLSGTSATGSTYMSVYPGTTYTGTANVNVSKTDPASAAFTVVALPTDGSRRITVRNGVASVHAFVDLAGYFTASSSAAGYTSLTTAKRVLNQKIAPNHTVTVNPGVGQASAAVVDLAVLSPSGTGYFTAAPTCSTSTSSLTYGRYSRNNLAFVHLSPSGTFCLGVHGKAAATAVVDVVGYFGTGGAGYVPLPAGQRVIDTRYDKGGNGAGHSTAPLGAARSTSFYEAGIADVPAAATGLLTSVTELNSTGNGYLQLFPGSTRPSTATSTVSFTKGRVVPNGAVAPLSSGHLLGVFNSAGTTNVVIDMFGYFI